MMCENTVVSVDMRSLVNLTINSLQLICNLDLNY